MDLTPFDAIIPCGIQGRSVTSVGSHLESSGGTVPASMQTDAHDDALLAEYRTAIVEAFEHEFEARVSHAEYALE